MVPFEALEMEAGGRGSADNRAYGPLDSRASSPGAGGGECKEQQFVVGRVLLRRLRRVAATALADRTQGRLGWQYAGLVCGRLAAEGVYYYAGALPSEFYRVLGDRDAAAFGPLLARCVAIVAAAGASRAALDYAAGLLGVGLRLALGRHTHARYLRRPGLYAVASGGAVDNPDQRITQDIERLAAGVAKTLPELLIAPFLIAYYSYRCWAAAGLLGPLSIYAYFGLGAAASRLAMAPVIRRVCALERAEGDLRFGHVRAGECAEAIAFFGGEARERAQADAALAAAADAQRGVLRRQLVLGLLTQVFSYMGSTVSYLVIGIPILLGAYSDKSGAELSSLISLNAFVSIYLIFRFTSVVEQSSVLADVAGYATRVAQLWEELDGVAAADGDGDGDGDDGAACADQQQGAAIVAAGLEVRAPDGARLVAGLDLEIAPGDSLVITGRNGSGKTSLLRTLCGLWRPAAGEVRLPGAGLFFLPQAPYIVAGSLRDQISYPGAWGGRRRECTDGDVAALLGAVGLAHLRGRSGGADAPLSVREWLALLSPGEQQRISIARVLFWRPAFAALDESTSALDAEAEAALYGALLDAGITPVSVSHHEGLASLHRRTLRLDGRGGYTLGF
ncbi:hypothetical protein H4R18_002325 [Coemansia javaensis]|uniref:Uncharacterized protein n=1 Tax=Coemansia javaensis TaxID=2761396 RepID=A0A9W8HEV9_9FUNG|nr:hypothetical protein H4R18_002325 [Coemansia javaensis]